MIHKKTYRIIGTLLMAALMAVPVLAENTASGEMNLIAQKYTGQRTDFTGNVGYEFVPAEALSVTALGRSVSGATLQRAHAVTLWDPVTEKPLAQVSVSSAYKVDERGFAFERLPVPLTLEQGRSYRITSGEEAGGDPMMEIGEYAYTWYTPDANTQRKNNIAQRDAGVAEKFGVLPSISMGWAREAWGVGDGGWATKADYQALLQWTRDELMPSHPADSLGRKIVMLPNWNEFGEGHFLMPSTLTGFGYLDAMREVFAGGGAHEDVKPTAQQKSRFTVLYPRD